MKVRKLSLEESLDDFDSSSVFHKPENIKWTPATDIFGEDTDIMVVSGYDDDFSAPEYMPAMDDDQDIPDGPKEGSDTGVSNMLLTAINDELDTIRKYNDYIATLRAESSNNPIYESFINVISDISNEENKHVGQLQELLTRISPNAESIDLGRKEGEDQLRFTGGLLPVESWDTPVENKTPSANHVDNTCTLADIDDEW